MLYINTNLITSYSTTRSIKKLNKIKFIIINKRRSKYRGVSKNGNKWQVLIMVNHKKFYLGSYGNKASQFYLQLLSIEKIDERKVNIKSNNISDFIKQLIDW